MFVFFLSRVKNLILSFTLLMGSMSTISSIAYTQLMWVKQRHAKHTQKIYPRRSRLSLISTPAGIRKPHTCLVWSQLVYYSLLLSTKKTCKTQEFDEQKQNNIISSTTRYKEYKENVAKQIHTRHETQQEDLKNKIKNIRCKTHE